MSEGISEAQYYAALGITNLKPRGDTPAEMLGVSESVLRTVAARHRGASDERASASPSVPALNEPEPAALNEVFKKLESLVQSRLGMSAERAALYVGSQVLERRSRAYATPDSVIEDLRSYAKVLESKQPLRSAARVTAVGERKGS